MNKIRSKISIGLRVKYLSFLSDFFEENLNVNFVKIRPLGVELFLTDR